MPSSQSIPLVEGSSLDHLLEASGYKSDARTKLFHGLSDLQVMDVIEAEDRLRSLESDSFNVVFEKGAIARKAKADFDHGDFLPWLKARFKTYRSIQKCMRVDEHLGPYRTSLARLSQNSLEAMVKDTACQEDRDRVVSALTTNPKMGDSELRQLLKPFRKQKATPKIVSEKRRVSDIVGAEAVVEKIAPILTDIFDDATRILNEVDPANFIAVLIETAERYCEKESA